MKKINDTSENLRTNASADYVSSDTKDVNQLASLTPPTLQLKKNDQSSEEANNDLDQSDQQTYQLAAAEEGGADDGDNSMPSNNTGLPNQLKSGVENLSGYSLDDVKVHYNSDKPAQLQANAYAQGSDIHIGPGQEKHLPHEAWHVVQQKQGRVRPTTQLKSFEINDDSFLEREADQMGQKALQMKAEDHSSETLDQASGSNVVQRAIGFEYEAQKWSVFVGQDYEADEGGEVKPPDPSRNMYQEQEDKRAQEMEQTRRAVLGDFERIESQGGELDSRQRILKENALRGGYQETLASYGKKVPPKEIVMKRYTDFNIETDGPYEDGRMDIEIVTKPFEESNEGIQKMNDAFVEIKAFFNVLDRNAPKDYKKGEFIGPDTHGIAGDIYISGDSGDTLVKMQATQGLSLQDIPIVFDYFGTKEGQESNSDKKNKEYARTLLRGYKGEANAITDLVGRSPALAQNIINELVSGDIINADEPGLGQFKGFLTMAMMYIQSLKSLDPDGLKTKIPFLSRFNFVDLYQNLPVILRGKILNGGYDLELAIDNAMEPVEKGFDTCHSLIRQINPYLGSVSFSRYKPVFNLLQQLTAQDWIWGIIEDGVDYLTQGGIMTFLDQSGAEYEEYSKSIKIFMRGHGVSEGLMGETDGLAIVENRAIAPHHQRNSKETNVTLEEAKQISKSYLEFGSKISKANHDPSEVGAFPKISSLKEGCFLTTACVHYKGLDDNCEELSLLRNFRDTYMRRKEDLEYLLKLYYEISPLIVLKIEQDKNRKNIYEIIYKAIQRCVRFIKRNDMDSTMKIYSTMVVKLADRYDLTPSL